MLSKPLKDGGFDLDGMLQQIDNKTSGYAILTIQLGLTFRTMNYLIS